MTNDKKVADIIEAFVSDIENEYETLHEKVQAAIDGLCDGQALANLGYVDQDQPEIEEAYSRLVSLRDRLEKTLWIDDGNGRHELTLEAIYDRFAKECLTPLGSGKEFFYDMEDRALKHWRINGLDARLKFVFEDIDFASAWQKLIDFALIDLDNDPAVSWAWNREDLEVDDEE